MLKYHEVWKIEVEEFGFFTVIGNQDILYLFSGIDVIWILSKTHCH